MELILSFMAIGTFCVVAATIETVLGSQPSNYKLSKNKQHRRSGS
jgi:hypothetical protein